METLLPRSTPKSEGTDPAGIIRFIEIAEREKFTTHSLMIVRHGKVISETWWEPYREDEYHLLYSLTKSFASTAVGFAISEGAFGLDDLVIDLLREQAPAEISENLGKLKVRHLLSMSVGHDVEPNIGVKDNDWQTCAANFLAHSIPHTPGRHFLYNTAASNMLSILIQKTTGETLDQFLGTRLLQPLGISNVKWTRGPNFVWGGSGLHTTTEAIAKLGLLYLNKGVWDGRQLLPEGWAETATSYQVPNGPDPENDWNQGYGFQFWRCRHHAVRGDGAFGQFCLMIPEFDVVVAITSGDSDLQRVLNTVWDILLPAFEPLRSVSDEVPPRVRSLGPADILVRPPRFKAEGDGLDVEIEGDKGSLTHSEPIPLNTESWVEFPYRFGGSETVTARAKAGWSSAVQLEVSIWDPYSPRQHEFIFHTDGRASFVERGGFNALAPQEFNLVVEVSYRH